jgi:hypothetical protein
MKIIEALKTHQIEIKHKVVSGFNKLEYREGNNTFYITKHRVYWKKDRVYYDIKGEEKAVEKLLED